MSQLYSYSLCNSTIDLSPVPGASSEGSSPRSSSTDDDLLEIRASEQNACNHSKPIYNFSIPDFIKHERQPDTNAADNSEMDSPVIVSECVPRARVMNMKRRRERVDDIEERDTGNRLGLSAGFAPARRHKRKRGNHRDPVSSPQLIDLTDSTDQEDAVTPGVRDEINHSPYLDSALTGVAEHSWDLGASQSPHTPSLNSVTDDLQDFGIRLRASRERLDQLRRDVAASGLVLSQQGAGQSQNIVSDGLAYPSNHDGDARGGATALSETFELLNQAAPIINVDDDTIDPVTPDREGGRQMAARMLQDRDREIAARMFEDPFYSPPFLTPRNVRQRDSSPRPRPTMRPVLTTIEEDLDRIRQTTREQIASFERVRQQTRTRLNEARNRMSRIAHRNIIDIFPLPVPDSPPENRQSEDEVEFLRELRPPNSSANRNARASHADLDANNETNYNWGHLSRARRRFSGLLANPNLNVPDFLFPYVQLFSPSVAPRLHHFPSNNTDEGEDYEALWNLAERLGPAKPRGLSKTEIDRIHAFRFSAACAEETNSTCVVCMSEYIFREKIRKLPCSHDFHSKCIDKWLRSNKTCPVCRDEVKCI